MKNLTAFFVPLGISALLVTVSHVIINGTLARATIQQELVISAYAIAMSVFGLFEIAHPAQADLFRPRSGSQVVLFAFCRLFLSDRRLARHQCPDRLHATGELVFCNRIRC